MKMRRMPARIRRILTKPGKLIRENALNLRVVAIIETLPARGKNHLTTRREASTVAALFLKPFL